MACNIELKNTKKAIKDAEVQKKEKKKDPIESAKIAAKIEQLKK